MRKKRKMKQWIPCTTSQLDIHGDPIMLYIKATDEIREISDDSETLDSLTIPPSVYDRAFSLFLNECKDHGVELIGKEIYIKTDEANYKTAKANILAAIKSIYEMNDLFYLKTN